MKMLKKSLIAIAVLVVVMPAFAGDKKWHDPWPTTYVPQEITTIDVIMDVGFYIHIVNQDSIKVTQDGTIGDKNPYTNYSGCATGDVVSNFAAVLSVSAAAVSGAAGGSWSASITPSSIGAGTTQVTICVQGTGLDITGLAGGQKNVKVAKVTVSVKPA